MHWPVLTVRRVANGWVVSPANESGTYSVLGEMYVFNDWDSAQKHMLETTYPNSEREDY